MSDQVLDIPQDNSDQESRFALSAIKAAMALPRARVDRASFLQKELRPHSSEEQAEDAIGSNPAQANIPINTIDAIADSIIKSHVAIAAGSSFVAGIPGGIAMAITIPADTAQFVWHAIVLAQKLAYLYGWPDLIQENDPDEETQYRMALLVGSMLGIGKANQVLTEISKEFAQQVAKRLPTYALTKTAYYPIIKTIAKWVGISLTKQSFAKAVAKVIPILSGVASAGLTASAFHPMARNLKNHLRELEYAKRQ